MAGGLRLFFLCATLALAPGVPASSQSQLPDFTITGFGIAPSGMLEATLHNTGGWAANYQFEVNLYNAEKNIRVERFRSLDLDPAMALRTGGAQLKVQLSKTLLPPGKYPYALVIDDGNVVPEANEDNNRAEITATVASQLVMAGVVGRTRRTAAGTSAIVIANVQNRGNTSTEWDGARCVLKAGAPEGEKEFDLGILKPGESRSLTIQTVLPSLTKTWTMTLGCYTPANTFRKISDTPVIPRAGK